MSLNELKSEFDGLIEIKEQLLEVDDESLDDEIDVIIGRLLQRMIEGEA